jgi:hypothetical protein
MQVNSDYAASLTTIDNGTNGPVINVKTNIKQSLFGKLFVR